MCVKKVFNCFGLMATAVLTAGLAVSAVGGQSVDTAYVPFLVNVNATVSAIPSSGGSTITPVTMSVSANQEKEMAIPIAIPLSARSHKQFSGNQAIMTDSRGKVTLKLPAQEYENAEVSLYSMNGRLVMRTKAAASEAAKSISRGNVVAGVYLLSVNGANGKSFSNRITHKGGNLNINVGFSGRDNGGLIRTASTDVFSYIIIVSAPNYNDSSYMLDVSAVKENARQTIILQQAAAAGPYEIMFNANGGDVFPMGSTTNANNKLETLPVPVRSGYIFDGWFTLNGTMADTAMVFNSNATIYAKWVENVFTDSRDRQTYSIAIIGGQTWMTENLNYAGSDGNIGVCYEDYASNCAIYGRLYTWSEAMVINKRYDTALWSGSDSNHQGICPDGWHVPSDAEWTELENAVGGNITAGIKLKSRTGWLPNGNGTDDYGFTALAGGRRYADGSFNDTGRYGFWWSATEGEGSEETRAWYRNMYTSFDDVYRNTLSKINANSIRCVKD